MSRNTWFRSELEAILSLNNNAIKKLVRENPTDGILDRDDPEWANYKIYRTRIKTPSTEVYAEMSERIASIFKESG